MTGSVQTPLRGRGKGRWRVLSIWTFLPPDPTPSSPAVFSHPSGLTQLPKPWATL